MEKSTSLGIMVVQLQLYHRKWKTQGKKSVFSVNNPLRYCACLYPEQNASSDFTLCSPIILTKVGIIMVRKRR